MKILLVYPIFPETYWSFSHALKFQKKRAAFPPLGLLTVSAMLPESWERRLVDMNVEELTEEDINWADMVFCSAMIVQQNSLKEVVRLCKQHSKRLVVGGPYVTTSTNQLLGADHILKGEVETTLPQFLNDLKKGEAKRVYEPPTDRPGLTDTPVPDFHLANFKLYSAMSVQYSRGCPFNCEFCDIITIYGRKPRTKTNKQILDELDKLCSLGWRGHVFIVDDNFIGNKPNVKKLLPDLAKWQQLNNWPFRFLTEASVNLAHDTELLEGMQSAGFEKVFLGIETPVANSLVEAQKSQNTRLDLLDAVKIIQSYGMEVMAGFIVGFDNDPENIFTLQENFIQNSGIPLAMVGLLSALPDTQLWNRLAKENRLIAQSTGNNTDGFLNFIPKMDSKMLIEGYKNILRNIYNPRAYYKRSMDCLKLVSTRARQSQGGNPIENIKAFFRIVITLGVRDSERLEFWCFIARVIMEHPKKFGDAVTLAAMGYHFRKLTL
jgi:radical SAM superfamily enzyme YgiQ (UPF0313 family)